MAGKSKVGQYLKSRGSTQREAAKVLHLTETSFSNKANGYREFKLDEIKKLKDAYGMTWEEVEEVFL